MARREERELTENKDDMSEAALVRGAHDTRQRLTGRTEFKFEIGKIVSSEKLLDQMEKTKKLMLERNLLRLAVSCSLLTTIPNILLSAF